MVLILVALHMPGKISNRSFKRGWEGLSHGNFTVEVILNNINVLNTNSMILGRGGVRKKEETSLTEMVSY